MTLYTARDRQKIKETIEFLISYGREITLQIEGQPTSYTTRIVKANYGDVQSRYGNGPQLVLERLALEDGNALFESGSQLIAKFLLRNTSCRFITEYIGPRSDYPDSDLLVSFPASIELPERRRRKRRSTEIPEFISVILTPKEGSKKDRDYTLDVADYSKDGVGILVREKNSHLIEIVQEGDKLQEITLFAPQTMIKVGGTVRHKSKKQGTQENGSYVLGIEFDESLMDFNPP